VGTMVASASADKVVSYIPLGGKISVDLSITMVRKFLCTPTKSGVVPTEADIVKFIKLCQARELDPWVGDAFLVGYDSKNGPMFNLITAQQALLKRAEINGDFDGMESGVIFSVDGKIDQRQGDFLIDEEKLLGGWARVFRKNQGTPSYDSVKLSTFNTGVSRWAADPAGMIVKVAESSALRKAFPTQLGGLYTREEMENIASERIAGRGPIDQAKQITSLDDLKDRLEGTAEQKPKQVTRATVVETPKSIVNPYAADFADCKTREEVTLRHGELMAAPEGETDAAQIDAAAMARKSELKA